MIAPRALLRHNALMNALWTAALTLGPSTAVLLILWLMETLW